MRMVRGPQPGLRSCEYKDTSFLLSCTNASFLSVFVKETCLKHRMLKRPHIYHQPHSFTSVASCSRLNAYILREWQAKFDHCSANKFRNQSCDWQKTFCLLKKKNWDHIIYTNCRISHSRMGKGPINNYSRLKRRFCPIQSSLKINGLCFKGLIS